MTDRKKTNMPPIFDLRGINTGGISKVCKKSMLGHTDFTSSVCLVDWSSRVKVHLPSRLAAITWPSLIFTILRYLGDDYIGSLQFRSIGNDSLPPCFEHFPTSKMKNNCMKIVLKFKKWLVPYNLETTFVIIHHHVLQWFSPIHINRHIVK